MRKKWNFINVLVICCLLLAIFTAAGYGNNLNTIRETKEKDDPTSTVTSIGLIPRGHDFIDNYYSGGYDFYQSELFWASASVKDKSGKLITGLHLDDFKLTEAIVTPDGEEVTKPHKINIALNKEHDWEVPWFWERTVSNEKFDIVFLVERRGTMSDAMPGIRSQIHKFVHRLSSNFIDFRVAGIGFGETPEFDYRTEINNLQDTAWKALKKQEEINNWAVTLGGLTAILKPMTIAIDALASIYPYFEDTADAVHGFIAALDRIQVIATSIEFGLRVDSLDTFGNIAEKLAPVAFKTHKLEISVLQ